MLYDEIEVIVCEGDGAITASKAKELLGWLEESEGIKLGGEGQPEVHTKTPNGTKVHLSNNTSNRPIDLLSVELLSQEILRRRWRLNGETIIIGRTGLILEGQHTLLALINAAHRWHEKPGQYSDCWETEPTLEKVVVRGIAEDDETVNTINTGRPRSLSDVLYRSDLFRNYPAKTRRKISKSMDHAVRVLWHRTGAKDNAFAPRRTHSEAMDFISRHSRLLECIKHCYEENGTENRIVKVGKTNVGVAAALMYLMAVCKSDGDHPEGYFHSSHRDESGLDFSLWDKAGEFWTLLAAGAKELQAIRMAFADMAEKRGQITAAERQAVLVLAWNCWSSGSKVTVSALELEYRTDDEGYSRMDGAPPIVGGIDIGRPVE